MAGIEAYVDLIPEFASLAGQIQRGVEQSIKKVKAEIPFGADLGSMSKDVAKEADTAATKAAQSVDFSAAVGSMTKDVGKEASTAATKAAASVDFTAASSFGGLTKDASSAAGKAAADVKFSADTGGLAGDVKSAAKKAESSAEVTIPVEVDESGARSKLGKLGDKGKEVGGAFGEEFSGSAMEGIGAGKLVGKAGWVGLAVTAAGIFAEGFTGALDQADAGRHTQAALGLSPAEAKKYSKTASDIYKDNWGESVEDVNTAIAEVRGGIKGLASQKDLKKATEEALAYSDVFGVEVGPAATSAGTLIKNGLAKDSTEAFDLMTKSAQVAGPQMTEPILDAVNEYSKHFTSLGIQGPQAMGILTKAAEDGEIGIDKAGDAIKEFGIRATDLGDTGAQDALKNMGLDGKQLGSDLLKGGADGAKAFDTIVSGLQDIKDPAEQAQAATALFGTPLEDMSKDKIPGFLDALSSGKDSMDDFAGSTKKAGDTISSGPGATIETFKRKVKQNLVDFIGGSVIPGLQKAGDAVKVFFGAVSGKGSDANVGAATGPIEEAGKKYHDLFASIKNNKDFQSMGDSLKSIGQSLQTFFGIVGNAARQLWDVIGPTVKKLFDNLKTTVGDTFKGVLKSISGGLELIAGLLSGDPKKIKEGAGKLFGGMKDSAVAMGKGMVKGVTTVLDPIGQAVGKKVGKAKDAATKKFSEMKSGAMKKAGELKDGAVQKFTQLKDGAVSRVTKLKDGAVSRFTSLKDAAGKKVSALKDSVSSQFGKTRDAVVDRMGKLKDGAVSKLSSLKDYGTGKFKAGWDHMKNVLSNPAESARRAFSNLFGSGGKVRTIFNGFITATKGIFGKLAGIIVKPINAMIGVVNTGLIRDGINFLLGKVGVDKKNQLPWIKPIKLADGGRPIDHRGVVHGPGGERSDKVPTLLSPHEVVTNAKAAKSVGYDTMKFINDTGMLPPQRLANGGRVWPTSTHALSNNYAGHSGVDIAAGMGSPIYAPEPGKITYTGWGHGYGQAIFEQFTNGLQAVFGHTSKVVTKAGASVDAGQLLGLTGNTGRSSGPHLHFEVNSPGAFGTPANRAASMSFLNGANVSGKGGGVGAAIGNIWSTIKDQAGKLVNDPMDWLTSKIGKLKEIGSSPLAQGLMKIPGYLLGKAKDWVLSKVMGGGDGTSATWNGAGVGSLGPDQLNNAATIIATARKLGFGDRGAIIGLMTAMQESTLRNLSGGDRDSVGLFQQRAPWGSFAARTNPAQAAAMFFNGGNGGQPGLRSKDWQHMGLGEAAQAVQVSAFPGAYTKWEGLARQLVGKYATGGTTPRSGVSLLGENGPELVKLPGASTVSTKRQTAAMLGQERITYFTIDNWEKGIGHFRSIAQEEIDQADEFAGTMNSMRGR